MTNEQHIENLKKLKSFHNGSYGSDIDRAIKALKQEPCDDAISRQALLDAFGFSEKTRKWGGDHSGYDTMMLYEIQDVIESQPPVNPQEPKTGHWIDVDGIWFKCSECDAHRKMTPAYKEYYCPHCGAKMNEPQESEVTDADSN